MYTICYIAFFVLSTAAAFNNDKGNQMHFTDNQTRYTLPLLLRLVHTQRKCKNRIQLLLYPAFIANNTNFNRNPLRGRNYGLEGGNYCRLNYYLEKNIAVLCYTN